MISTTRRLFRHTVLPFLCVFLFIQPSSYYVVAQSCYDDFNDIYDREALVTDTTFPRTYVICPRRIYEIATLDINGDVKEPSGSGVLPPLPIRPNMTIRCGDLGSRDDMCWISGGDLQIDATSIRGIADPTVENVKIQGFIFVGAQKHSLWSTKPGSITFHDCEWRVRIRLLKITA
jgi:hypothetical protein